MTAERFQSPVPHHDSPSAPLPSPRKPSPRKRSWLHRLFQQWETHPRQGWLWLGLWLGLVGAIAFILGLGSVGLVDETEPLFAEAARQMILRHDWVTPYFNEVTRFDKPPLIYWLMALGYQLIGVNEWAVRLPSALSAIALTACVLGVLVRYGVPAYRRESSPAYSRWLTAGLGVALTAFNLETIAWGRIGVSDMLLSGCFGAALLTFFMGYAAPPGSDPEKGPEKDTGKDTGKASDRAPLWGVLGFTPKDRWYLLSYFCIALAVLAKGPVGIVLPGIIVIGFTLYTGQLGATLVEMKLWRGLPLVALLTLPWYGLVIQANGEAYTRSFFGYHNFSRFTQTVNNHAAPWYFYFLVVLVGFAPWSLFLPAAMVRLRLWQRRYWLQQPRSAQLGVFACAWFVGVFGFFTVAATKLPSYVLPLMPAAAILVALLWSDEMTLPAGVAPGLRRSGWLNVAFVLVIGGAIAASPLWLRLIEDDSMPEFPEALGRSGLLIYGALFCLQMAIALWILQRRGQQRWLWSVNLIGFVAILLFVLGPTFWLVDAYRQAPLRQMAATTVQERGADEELIMVGFEKPTVVFYSQRPMLFFRRSRSTLRYIETYSLRQRETDSLLILTHPWKLKDLGLSPAVIEPLDQAGTYLLVRVNKSVWRDLFAEQLREPGASIKSEAWGKADRSGLPAGDKAADRRPRSPRQAAPGQTPSHSSNLQN